MVALHTPAGMIGHQAPDFQLLGVDDQSWSLMDCQGKKGLLVMFICNHCPYVQAIIERIVQDTNELQNYGVNAVAIMPNDTTQYPEDSFEHMKTLASHYQFGFPYLLDEAQTVAKAYGAVCTPDFFGYNHALELQYRGRLDASDREYVPHARRDLFEAMKHIAQTSQGPKEQIPSVGCSIKWRD